MSMPRDMPDDACVYKVGERKHLSGRLKAHHATYDHLIADPDQLELMRYAPIPHHSTGETVEGKCLDLQANIPRNTGAHSRKA